MPKPEELVHAVITARFDLGFIVEHPNGRFGQLRVPEMSRLTAECDRSPEERAGIGISVDVVHETDDGYLFSEFSAAERSARDEKHEDWIKAQEEARVGHTLFVHVERKLDWGCICRQEAEPFLEGVIASPETIAKNQLPSQCVVAASDWDRLTTGSSLCVVIAHKQWAHWRYNLYFSLNDQSSHANDS